VKITVKVCFFRAALSQASNLTADLVSAARKRSDGAIGVNDLVGVRK
jgi:hypothetical protein